MLISKIHMNKKESIISEDFTWLGAGLLKTVQAACISVWMILTPIQQSSAQANDTYMSEYYPKYNNKSLKELQKEYDIEKEDIQKEVSLFDEYGEKAITAYNNNLSFWESDIDKFESCYRDQCIQDNLNKEMNDVKNMKNIDGLKHIVRFFLVRAIALQTESRWNTHEDATKLKIILKNWKSLKALSE